MHLTVVLDGKLRDTLTRRKYPEIKRSVVLHHDTRFASVNGHGQVPLIRMTVGMPRAHTVSRIHDGIASNEEFLEF